MKMRWRLKRFLPDIVDPLTPGIVSDYGVDLSWHERELLFALDYEVRAAMSKQRAENDRRVMEKGRGVK